MCTHVCNVYILPANNFLKVKSQNSNQITFNMMSNQNKINVYIYIKIPIQTEGERRMTLFHNLDGWKKEYQLKQVTKPSINFIDSILETSYGLSKDVIKKCSRWYYVKLSFSKPFTNHWCEFKCLMNGEWENIIDPKLGFTNHSFQISSQSVFLTFNYESIESVPTSNKTIKAHWIDVSKFIIPSYLTQTSSIVLQSTYKTYNLKPKSAIYKNYSPYIPYHYQWSLLCILSSLLHCTMPHTDYLTGMFPFPVTM